MKFFDITLPLEPGMIVWPGDTRFKREEKKGSAIVSKITMSSHTGTHVDAPRHFLFNNKGVDGIDLKKLIGPAQVFEIKAKKLIETREIDKLGIKKGDKILFKTRNWKLLRLRNFESNYVSLSLDAARYLAKKKIDLVGIDYFGIEAKGAPGHPVHKTLLRAGIVIIEGVDLSKIKAGNYNIAALPLKIQGSDGSPARIVLWK